MEVQKGTYQGGSDRGSTPGESSLLAATASELSAPLVLIRQLSLSLASAKNEERARLAQQLTLTSERVLRMTRTLAFHGDTPQLINLEPVNAVTLCNEVVHELSPLFIAHGKSIMMQPRSQSPLMVADRSLLRQLLVSFGDNALHYSTHDQPVRLTVASYRDMVRIGVRDYGPAVPRDVWERLDERIAKRSVVTLPRRPQVSGVGLLAVRNLASAMGGLVGVTRHHDGATFYVDMKLSGQLQLL